MSTKNSRASPPQNLESLIETKVEESLKKKLDELWGKVRWFIWGLGLLVILLTGSGLMSGRSLLGTHSRPNLRV
ncbi:MAG: hypothetical protein O7D29_09435 [Gemmatimonadetes bacterium]|nr:hypothetical protein [Gemmatimonadota bacterium]